VTQEYRVEGPVMIFLTTTSADRRRALNRCIVLTVDEDREQTRKRSTESSGVKSG